MLKKYVCRICLDHDKETNDPKPDGLCVLKVNAYGDDIPTDCPFNVSDGPDWKECNYV